MNRRLSRLGATATLILALGAAWKIAQRRAALLHETADLRRDVRHFDSQVSDVESRIAVLGVVPRHPSSAKTVAVGPEGSRAITEMERNRIIQAGAVGDAFCHYAGFFRLYGLSRDQIKRFDAAVAEHHLIEGDLGRAANKQGLTSDDPSLASLTAEEANRYGAALVSILGADGPTAVAGYDEARPMRGIPESLAQALSDSPNPLTTAQFDQLTQLVQSFSIPQPYDGPYLPDVDLDAVIAKAGRFLSAGQVDEIRDASTLYDRSVAIERIWAIYRHWRKAGGAGS